MIIWLLFIALEIYRNYLLIEVRKSKPIYIHSFIIRGIAAIIHGAAVINVYSWKEYLPVFIFQITSFWLLF